MATLKISVSLPNLTTAQLANFEAGRDVIKFQDRLQGIANANTANVNGPVTPTQATVWTNENGTAATATVTCVTVANNSTVTLNNVTLTGKTSAPSGVSQFLCGVSASADAAALVSCINNHTSTSISGIVTAANVLGVVTITSVDKDTRANCYGLASSDGTNLAVTAFTGGAFDTNKVTVNI